VILTGVFFFLLTVVLSSKKLSLKIIYLFEKIKFTSKHAEKLYTAYESTYNLIKLKPLLIVVGMSVVAWFFECMGFYIVLRVFTSVTNIEVTVLTATFIYTFSTLIGAIAMLPGGLGATEASITGLLIFLKIPKDISVAATIIIRVATLWFAVLVGVIAVQIYGKGGKIRLNTVNE
jgi:uncharacterized protein (TIRG00374 family)